MRKAILLSLGFVAILFLVAFVHNRVSGPKVVNSCPTDVLVCRDGNTVSRTGADCSFAVCPDLPVQEVEEWETISDPRKGISYQYPVSLGTEFITPEIWPPHVARTDTPFSCVEGGGTLMRDVSGTSFCVKTESEGAAGSVYTTYTYSATMNASLVTLTTTLRLVQCGNYDEERKNVCEQERAGFDLDGIAKRIMESTTPLYECEDDLKICADGTQVGRVGQQCTFAQCPTEAPMPGDTSLRGSGVLRGVVKNRCTPQAGTDCKDVPSLIAVNAEDTTTHKITAATKTTATGVFVMDIPAGTYRIFAGKKGEPSGCEEYEVVIAPGTDISQDIRCNETI